MEQQLLEVLIKLDTKLDNLEKNMLCIQDEIKDIKQDIKDRFDVTDMKLNVIENKVTQVGRKLVKWLLQEEKLNDNRKNIKSFM